MVSIKFINLYITGILIIYQEVRSKWHLEKVEEAAKEAALIESLEKCTTSHVVNVVLKLKYLLNQLKADLYFAKIAT